MVPLQFSEGFEETWVEIGTVGKQNSFSNKCKLFPQLFRTRHRHGTKTGRKKKRKRSSMRPGKWENSGAHIKVGAVGISISISHSKLTGRERLTCPPGAETNFVHPRLYSVKCHWPNLIIRVS